MERHIAFVGDSFCSDYELTGKKLKNLLYLKKTSLWQNQSHVVNDGAIDNNTCVLWPTEVARMLGYRVANFGFGGMSWWHSWYMFLTHYWNNPNIDRNCLQVIVFCHTNPDRVNSAGCPGLMKGNLNKHHIRGLGYYFEHLHDRNFAEWARDQYFYDIQRRFSCIKTVHLFCFDTSKSENWQILPGLRFVNPLVWISVGELTGTSEQITNQMSFEETRKNHMNNYNNQVLSELVFNAIENYSPGERLLDLSRFRLVNNHCQQWPHGNYGTK
jgi:hypothetical protein